MSADRCQGCARNLGRLGALLISPAWLLYGLVLAWARLGDLARQRGYRRRRR
ncbi:hypothetical protein ACVMGC_011521 [Bradyrhizobium barranii subsp. barranii]|uniref:hypothetical protein n=1 Tax=Bradyrhizobium japonicum TaxID=375 RepID=UPI000B134F5E|nr:hypothetical protein [Bradyrhizobium japonicum]